MGVSFIYFSEKSEFVQRWVEFMNIEKTRIYLFICYEFRISRWNCMCELSNVSSGLWLITMFCRSTKQKSIDAVPQKQGPKTMIFSFLLRKSKPNRGRMDLYLRYPKNVYIRCSVIDYFSVYVYTLRNWNNKKRRNAWWGKSTL